MSKLFSKRRKPVHNRIQATREELLTLTFAGDLETADDKARARQAKRRLVPQPPRSCSRQTGAIVYRHYDNGANPFRVVDREENNSDLPKSLPEKAIPAVTVDDPEFGNFMEPDDRPESAPRSPAPPFPALQLSASPLLRALKVEFEVDRSSQVPKSAVPRLPLLAEKKTTVYRIAARTARQELETLNPTLQHKPSKILDQQRVDRRKEMLIRNQALLRHHNVVESSKVDELVRAVLALNYETDEVHVGSTGRGKRNGGGQDTVTARGKSTDQGRRKTLTGLTVATKMVTSDERYGFGLEDVKLMHTQYEELLLNYGFLGCLSTGNPILLGNAVITQQQLKKCCDVNLDIKFAAVVRLCRPDVPNEHLVEILQQWEKHREELQQCTTASFREKLDLAAVKDIERVWAGVLEMFSQSNHEVLLAAAPPHERGLTLEEYTQYVSHMTATISADDAKYFFDRHSVPGVPGEMTKPEPSKQKPLRELSRTRSIVFNNGDRNLADAAPSLSRREGSFHGIVRTGSMVPSSSDDLETRPRRNAARRHSLRVDRSATKPHSPPRNGSPEISNFVPILTIEGFAAIVSNR
jgi:hypothetical protein